MEIRHVTAENLNAALAHATTQYAGNLAFKRCDPKGRTGQTRQHTPRYTVTLTVLSSHAPGARRAPHTGRRIAAACWHAHRAFLDALPATAEVISSPMLIGESIRTWHPGEPHHDWTIGSQAYPCQASEACACEGEC